MEYYVGRVRNADQERTRLNEILRDIQRRFSLTETQIEDLRRQLGGITGVSGIVTSVNGNTGDVTITIQSIGGVPVTREINTTNSLIGGGNLSANRTLQLVGDVATPGPNQVYGTDGTGAKGWKADPAGGGGQVDSIVPRDGIDVDATDPANPEVSVLLSTDPGNTLSFGTDDGLFASGGGGGSSDGGPGAIIGSIGGPPLQVGARIEARTTVGYDNLDDWFLDIFPTGSAQVDVLVNGSSITGTGQPAVVGGTNATGDTTSWSATTIARNAVVTFEVLTISDGVEWINLSINGERT